MKSVTCNFISCPTRKANNNIMVVNLHKDGEGTIPNPVLTFEQAFGHYRKFYRLV